MESGILQLLGEIIDNTLHSTDVRKDKMNLTLFVHKLRSTIDKWHIINQKASAQIGNNESGNKKPTFERELISRIYKYFKNKE